MKKLTEDHFKLLKSKYPVLSMEELAQILGGNVSWDCLFNCMNYIDPSRTVAEYVALYTASTGLDPSMSGGVPPGSVTSILSLAGLSSTNHNNITNDKNISNIMVIANPDGTGHAVIATSTTREVTVPKSDGKGGYEKDQSGKIIMEKKKYVFYKDPTTDQIGEVDVDFITSIYQVQKPNTSGSGSGSDSEQGSSSSSSSSE